MTTLPNCPKCSSEFTYQDGMLLVCPECAHEWTSETADNAEDANEATKDAHGNILKNGDSITVLKSLKIKGSSQMVKVGTKVKNIRIVSGDHNIDGKIDGIGSMKLKSEFVKKA